jgi:hypothetical protein
MCGIKTAISFQEIDKEIIKSGAKAHGPTLHFHMTWIHGRLQCSGLKFEEVDRIVRTFASLNDWDM